MTNDSKRVLSRWCDGSRFGLRAVADLLDCSHRHAKLTIDRLIDSGWAMKIDRKRELYRLSNRGRDLGRGVDTHENPL